MFKYRRILVWGSLALLWLVTAVCFFVTGSLWGISESNSRYTTEIAYLDVLLKEMRALYKAEGPHPIDPEFCMKMATRSNNVTISAFGPDHVEFYSGVGGDHIIRLEIDPNGEVSLLRK